MKCLQARCFVQNIHGLCIFLMLCQTFHYLIWDMHSQHAYSPLFTTSFVSQLSRSVVFLVVISFSSSSLVPHLLWTHQKDQHISLSLSPICFSTSSPQGYVEVRLEFQIGELGYFWDFKIRHSELINQWHRGVEDAISSQLVYNK